MSDRVLIVNADDFGLAPGVNSGIILAHRRGILTSTTLMANMPYARQAVEMAADCPELGVGLHVNLTQGAPVAAASELRGLVDSSGALPSVPALMLRAWPARAAIRREIAAQVETALAMGVRLTHLDSHKHVHVHPVILEATISVAHEYGIRAMRVPVECRATCAGARAGDQGKAMLVSAMARQGRKRSIGRGLSATDHFVGMAQTGKWDPHSMAAAVTMVKPGVTEFMVHPGQVDDVLRSCRTRLVESRQAELDALTSDDVLAAVAAEGIRLASYADVQARWVE